MTVQAETVQNGLSHQWENYDCTVNYKSHVKILKISLPSVINVERNET